MDHGAGDGGAVRSRRCGARCRARGLCVRLAIAKGDVVAGTTAATSGLALFALGKHGGRELNYSSDIDIVAFFDPQRGALTDPVEATKIYHAHRAAAGGADAGPDRATATSSAPTCGCGPIPARRRSRISVDAAMAYYESRGQNWERAAWIKARACAGDKRRGRGVPRGARALHLAQASRLRDHRRHPGDEAPDQHREERRRRRGSRGTTSSSGAAASARSSSSPRPSS